MLTVSAIALICNRTVPLVWTFKMVCGPDMGDSHLFSMPIFNKTLSPIVKTCSLRLEFYLALFLSISCCLRCLMISQFAWCCTFKISLCQTPIVLEFFAELNERLISLQTQLLTKCPSMVLFHPTIHFEVQRCE